MEASSIPAAWTWGCYISSACATQSSEVSAHGLPLADLPRPSVSAKFSMQVTMLSCLELFRAEHFSIMTCERNQDFAHVSSLHLQFALRTCRRVTPKCKKGKVLMVGEFTNVSAIKNLTRTRGFSTELNAFAADEGGMLVREKASTEFKRVKPKYESSSRNLDWSTGVLHVTQPRLRKGDLCVTPSILRSLLPDQLVRQLGRR